MKTLMAVRARGQPNSRRSAMNDNKGTVLQQIERDGDHQDDKWK
jgi:hypothetical protein